MVPSAHVKHWRQHAPWPRDDYVEQDLVISRVLVELFDTPAIASQVAFRGGTALHKLHLSPAARYSEDIDLVQTTSEPIGPLVDAIRERLSWLDGKPKRNRGEKMFTMTYRFDTSGEPSVRMRLKVEINTRESSNEFGIIEEPFEVDSPWFRGRANLRTYTLEELLGTKLRALYARRKGRDVFDLVHALDLHPNLDRQRVVDCCLAYMAREGNSVNRSEFERNLDEKRNNADFMSDMHLLLDPEYGVYEPELSIAIIEREFLARLTP
jgi:predicted nucleotidyltransferase component of viral defense system